jgi:hypothetical protein
MIITFQYISQTLFQDDHWPAGSAIASVYVSKSLKMQVIVFSPYTHLYPPIPPYTPKKTVHVLDALKLALNRQRSGLWGWWW